MPAVRGSDCDDGGGIPLPSTFPCNITNVPLHYCSLINLSRDEENDYGHLPLVQQLRKEVQDERPTQPGPPTQVQGKRPGGQGIQTHAPGDPQEDHRPGAGGGGGAHLPLRRRSYPAHRRSGPGQDPARHLHQPGPGREFQAHPVHPGPAAHGHHRHRHFAGDRRGPARVRVRQGADLRQHHSRRRNQPHAAQDAVRPARGAAGASRRRVRPSTRPSTRNAASPARPPARRRGKSPPKSAARRS